MKIWKTLSLWLALAMLLTLLSGCGGSSPAPENTANNNDTTQKPSTTHHHPNPISTTHTPQRTNHVYST